MALQGSDFVDSSIPSSSFGLHVSARNGEYKVLKSSDTSGISGSLHDAIGQLGKLATYIEQLVYTLPNKYCD